MTPDEQHAWEVIKALAEKRRVEYKSRSGPVPYSYIMSDDWDKCDIRDIIDNPHLYRVVKEEQP